MGVGRFDSLLLLSFGGPESSEDVMPFLHNVTRGRGVPEERLAVVAGQYELFVGKSPINDLNRDLLESLGDELAVRGHDIRTITLERSGIYLVPDLSNVGAKMFRTPKTSKVSRQERP